MPATGTFNANALVNQLSDAVAVDANVKAQAWSRLLHLGALGYDDLAAFESDEVKPGSKASLDPGTPMGIICRKSDFGKIGGDTMHFTVMEAPAGPGVQGEGELTGNTSSPTFGTFKCTVDFKRDAVEYTKKHKKMMATGQGLQNATYQYMSHKMGLRRQREMMLTLRDRGTDSSDTSAANNVIRSWAYRPNGRASTDTLLATDTLDVTSCVQAKIRATRNGCRPLRVAKNRFGSRVHGYLAFATETAMQGIRGSEGYELALQNSHVRGDANPQFSGRLVEWQKIAWFEHSVVDPAWDDVKGSPLEPRAKVAVAVTLADDDPVIKFSTLAASKCLFLQDFLGYQLEMYESQADASLGEDWASIRPDANTYFAWFFNPSGTVGFLSYGKSNITAPDGTNYGQNLILTGANKNGVTDQIGILDPEGGATSEAGVSGHSAQIGNIVATGDSWGSSAGSGVGGTAAGTSANVTYATDIEAGATLIQANANGVCIGWSFLFGAFAAIRGYGQTDMLIQQDRDFGFVKGGGYEGVWGQKTAERGDGRTNGYTLIEHAIEPEGYTIPSVDADGNVVV